MKLHELSTTHLLCAPACISTIQVFMALYSIVLFVQQLYYCIVINHIDICCTVTYNALLT